MSKKLVLLFGSALRRACLSAARASNLELSAVATPAAPRFDSLTQAVLSEIGLEPARVHRTAVADYLRELNPDVVLCVGWPYLFDATVVDGPWLLLNSHPTLLPKHRGPNPWFYVLCEGWDHTGVTVHRISHGMDDGPILLQERVELNDFDTYRSLRAKLVGLEPEVIRQALNSLVDGHPQWVEQKEAEATVYPHKRTPADSELDPERPLVELFDFIRACDPDAFPAFFHYKGQKVCIRLWRPERPDNDHPESL